MKILNKQGNEIATCNVSNLAHALHMLGIHCHEVNIVLEPDEIKQRTREQINITADAQTREGIMADALAVMMVGVARLSVILSKAKTLEDVRLATADLAEFGEKITTEMNMGNLKFPYTIKPRGAMGALEDMFKLSNSVTTALTVKN